MKSRFAFILPLFAATLLSAAAGKSERTVVYVSIGGAKEIAILDLNASSGELTARAPVTLDGAPGPLAISPDKKFLYAALRANKSVQTLSVDATGALKPGGMSATGMNAAYIITDRTGRHLLTADYGGNRITVHPIRADGSIGQVPSADRMTGKNPHSIQADEANRFVFVPLCGVDQVLQFRFDAHTGNLDVNAVAEVAFKPVDGPRHFAFHPKKDFAYVVNEKSSSVTALTFDKKKGTMTPVQTLSTLPKEATTKNTCADIHVTPDGKFVYASNRGHDSLAGYSIDPKTGQLTYLGNTPTEKTPRAFAIDPSGQFVFAAGQGSEKLATYRIDAKTGGLQPLKVYDVGKGPAWVTVVSFGR